MSVDIVNLIESNPITKFSGDYQTKLIEKVKQIFTKFDKSEKVVHTMDTLGGSQQVTFLTEKLLYKLLLYIAPKSITYFYF